jgi:hypothetical protein
MLIVVTLMNVFMNGIILLKGIIDGVKELKDKVQKYCKQKKKNQ